METMKMNCQCNLNKSHECEEENGRPLYFQKNWLIHSKFNACRRCTAFHRGSKDFKRIKQLD